MVNPAPAKKNIWIKDPIHGFLELDTEKDKIFLDLINCPTMQRLRRVKQLGTSQFIYPGAEHSRFTHSLGTFRTAGKTLNHFRQRGFLQNEDYRREIEIPILAAALLHDIGHWPFSHSFELVTDIPHEEITKALILNNGDVNKILTEFDPQLPQKVTSLFEHKFFLPVGNAIIASQLDADRLDYICRDSYMTGTNYGFLDINRIISVLTIVSGQMAVLEKGLGTIEEYLLARYYMYWEVYYHKTSRGMTLLLGKIFQRARELLAGSAKAKKSMDFLVKRRWRILFEDLTAKDLPLILADFIRIDDTDIYYLLKEFAKNDDLIINDLSNRFLHRQIFKPVEIKSKAQRDKIKAMVKKSGLSPDFYFLEDEAIKRIYNPNLIETKAGQGIQVFINSKAKLVDISKISHIIGKLSKSSYSQKKYIYIPEEIRKEYYRLP